MLISASLIIENYYIFYTVNVGYRLWKCINNSKNNKRKKIIALSCRKCFEISTEFRLGETGIAVFPLYEWFVIIFLLHLVQ